MLLPDILLEDDDLVAFDKPSGLPVTAAPGDRAGRDSLLGLARTRYGEALAAVHRLDTEASGVVLCAKTKAALDFLSGQFQSKTVRKVQLAVAVVEPADPAVPSVAGARGATGLLAPEFTVDLDIGPDPSAPGRVRIYRRSGGKPGLTTFRVLETFGRFAWLECRPVTGRTHQVRVHLAAVGAPVLNDGLYGDAGVKLLLSDFKRGYKGREAERPLLGRLALHGSLLGFSHPVTRAPVEVVAPLPPDFGVALRTLRKYARPARSA
jgi:RluA family pseudouridine synthase